MANNYFWEKLYGAMGGLSRAPGDVRDRLCVAWTYVAPTIVISGLEKFGITLPAEQAVLWLRISSAMQADPDPRVSVDKLTADECGELADAYLALYGWAAATAGPDSPNRQPKPSAADTDSEAAEVS